eukprot:427563-Hanusia_phi.AAC.4
MSRRGGRKCSQRLADALERLPVPASESGQGGEGRDKGKERRDTGGQRGWRTEVMARARPWPLVSSASRRARESSRRMWRHVSSKQRSR